MKIQATIKKEETIEKEILLPYFCKDSFAYYKVIDEEKVLRVKTVDDLNAIGYAPFWLIKTDIAEAKEITEDEFNEAANRVLFDVSGGIPVPEIEFGGQQE